MGTLCRIAAALLLGLPLNLGFAGGAQAQTLSITAPANAPEGHSGTSDRHFTVSLSEPVSSVVEYQICFSGTATHDASGTRFNAGTITSGDYQIFRMKFFYSIPNCITQNIPAGDTSNAASGIRVGGDTSRESDETVIATLTLQDPIPSGVTLGTSTATHIILDDEPALEFTLSALEVAEDDSVGYDVKLVRQPTDTVTVSITSDNPDVTVDLPSLEFTTSNWSTTQTVTVTAAPDDDAAPDSAILLHTASGADYGSVTGRVRVAVTDDDTPGVILSTKTLEVTEGGETEFTMVLASQPTDNVFVDLEILEMDQEKITYPRGFAFAFLEFTSEDWNEKQTITVLGQEDLDINDDIVQLHLLPVFSNDPQYAGITLDPIEVRVSDNDDPVSGVSVAPQLKQVTVHEGEKRKFTISGLAPDITDVSLKIKSRSTATGNGGDFDLRDEDGELIGGVALSVEDGSVTFEVDVAEDVELEGDETLMLELWDRTDLSRQLLDLGTLTISDGPAGRKPTAVSFSSASGAHSEGDGTLVYTVTVELDPVPHANLLLDYSVSGAVFEDKNVPGLATTPEDFNLTGPGTVQVFAGDATAEISLGILQDDIDELDETVTLTLEATGRFAPDAQDPPGAGNGYILGSRSSHTLTILDDDAPAEGTPGVEISVLTLDVDESAVNPLPDKAVGIYSVVLTTAPTANVTVDVTSADPGAALLHTGSTAPAARTTLTFTPDDWNEEQLVTVTSQKDDDANDERLLITHAVSGTGNYASVRADTAVVNVYDIDVAGVTVSTRSLEIEEAGTPGTYTVRLDTDPQGTVTVDVSADPTASDPDAVTVSPERLTFTSADWSQVQTVTVTAVEDADTNQAVPQITHVVKGYRGFDDGSTPALDVSVTVGDDNAATPVAAFAQAASDVDEGAGTHEVIVALRPVPAAALTLAYQVSGGTATSGEDFGTLTGTVDVAAGTGETAIPITLVDDDTNERAETIVLTLTDGNSHDLGSTHVHTVTITDNDTPGALLSVSTLAVDEGGSDSYTVALAAPPTADVEITVTSGDPEKAPLLEEAGDVRESITLTFTTTNWDVEQTVTVLGGQDADIDNETVLITHRTASDDSRYHDLTIAPVEVTVTDSATTQVPGGIATVSSQAGSTYVSLRWGPASDAAGYEYRYSDDGGATWQDWSLIDNITILNPDTSPLLESAIANLTPDTEYVFELRGVNASGAGNAQSATVRTLPTVQPGVLLPVSTLAVDEGGSDSYTVALAAPPTADVEITVTSGDPEKAPLEEAGDVRESITLTFTTTNWDVEQTVTVLGGQNADIDNETVLITHRTASDDPRYQDLTIAPVEVTVIETTFTDVPGDIAQLEARAALPSDLVEPPDTYVVLRWSGASDASGHEYRYSDDGGATWQDWSLIDNFVLLNPGVFPPLFDSTIANLTPDTEYVFELRGVNRIGPGNAQSATVRTLPTVQPGVLLPVSTLAVDEGGSDSYTVALAAPPTADVEITVTSGDPEKAPLEEAGYVSESITLTFTTTNWDVEQTVTVLGGQDADIDNETVLITHRTASDDSRYHDLTIAPVEVTVTDSATTQVPGGIATVSSQAGSTYVSLRWGPASDAAGYEYRYSDDGGATWQDWSLIDNITILNPDTSPLLESAIANLTPDTEYVFELRGVNASGAGNAQSATVRTLPTVQPGVLLPVSTLAVDEGGSDSYTVALAAPPTADVEITVTSGDPEKAPLEEAGYVRESITLTFTTTNWDVEQTVTVLGGQDADIDNETVLITHRTASDDPRYQDLTIAPVEVTVADDDTRNILDAAAEAGLTRFGRTVGEQSVSAVRDRLSASRRSGFTGSFAGQALPSLDWSGDRGAAGAGGGDEPPVAGAGQDNAPEDAGLARSGTGDGTSGRSVAAVPGASGDAVTALRSWLAGPEDAAGDGAGDEVDVRALDTADILPGTSFTLTRETEAGGSLALWGRGAVSGFSGREGDVDLDGDVRSLMLGSDWSREDWTYGLMLSRSHGDIGYRGGAAPGGEIETELTALVPYVGWDVNDRLSAWGTFGFGQGEMRLRPDGGASVRTDIDWQMAAAGLEGALSPDRGLAGARLSWTADALWTRTGSDAVPGSLRSLSGETTRLRLGLEGSWERRLASGGALSPRLEMGLRHDGGDAETGFGLEIGGGLDWTDPTRGLLLGLSGRTLALHEDGSFGDWGVSAVLEYDPTPETKRGFAARLSHDLGGTSSGGMQALLGPDSFPGLNETAGGGNWALEAAYGVSRGRGRVGSSYMALSGTEAAEAARLGYRLEPDAPHAGDVSLDFWTEPAVQGSAETGDTSHSLGMDLNWQW